MKTYGYVRVSSTDQHEDRQLLAMQELEIPTENIFVDKQSGKDFNRQNYQEMMNLLLSGDLLYIKSIDRLGRNYDEVIEQWRVITKEKGVDVAVIDMPLLDTRIDKNLMNRFIADLVLQVLSFVAQKERETIRQRQAEGISAAKLRNVRFGRPPKDIPDNFGDLVQKWKRKQINTAEVLKMCNMSRATFYIKIKEYERFNRINGK